MMSDTTRRSRKPASRRLRVALVLSLVAVVNLPLMHSAEQAVAAGEVISVEPAVASRGDFITVTVSRISASSFCDYLPYAGDGYYMRVYLLDYEANAYFHIFEQESETFDPRKQESITLRVGPIPERYPLGEISVVGDCMYPDGQQTGNTAIPFTLTVVEEGQSAVTPEPAPEPATEPAPEPATPETAPAPSTSEETTNTDSDAASEDAQNPASSTEVSTLTARGRPEASAGLSFSVGQENTSARDAVLFLIGQLPEFDGEVTIELVSDSSDLELTSFTPSAGPLREEIVIPEGTEPGSYQLRATGEGLCAQTNCTKESQTSLVISDDSYEALGVRLPLGSAPGVMAPPTTAWIISGIGVLTAVVAMVMSFTLAKRRSGEGN